MYIIHEYQTDLNGNTAISSVPYHTAMICYHNGNLIEAECFEHLPEEAEETI